MSSIFTRIGQSLEPVHYSVIVSIAEIYNECVRDLLEPSQANLQIINKGKHGTKIRGLTEYLCADEQEVYQLVDIGNKNRAVGNNNVNLKSSRSHTIVTIQIVISADSKAANKIGKLQLVDLAGSERVSKTLAVGKNLLEAKNINQSLSTLGRLINAFNDPLCSHLPYRESKLTRILADSIGGNSKTCMIVTVSPHSDNQFETLSTLRYGAKA